MSVKIYAKAKDKKIQKGKNKGKHLEGIIMTKSKSAHFLVCVFYLIGIAMLTVMSPEIRPKPRPDMIAFDV